MINSNDCPIDYVGNPLYSKVVNRSIDDYIKARVTETDIKIARILVASSIGIGEEKKQKEVKSVLGIKD